LLISSSRKYHIALYLSRFLLLSFFLRLYSHLVLLFGTKGKGKKEKEELLMDYMCNSKCAAPVGFPHSPAIGRKRGAR
jgi:hypothetical protein